MRKTLKPKTVYLDSANWFNLVEGSADKERFGLAVKNGSVVPVVSFIHVLEFGNRDEPYRSCATAYVDSINSLSPILWIRGLPAIVEAEVRNAFLSAMGFPPVPVNPFMEHLVDALEVRLPWFDRTEARTCSFSEIVKLSASLKSRPGYHAFRKSSPVFDMSRLRALRKMNHTGYVVEDIQEYAANVLGNHVETSSGIVMDVTPELRKQFKQNFSLAHCPAFSHKLAFFDGWSQSSGGEEPSMFEDLFHLVALGYCDEVFVDKGTWEALKKGKAARQPLANREFKDWLDRLPVRPPED